MLLSLWSGFWEWGGTSTEPTRGGVADYRRYQKKLKRIAAAADKRLYGKLEKKVAALVKDAPLEIREEAEKIQSTIDFSAIAQDHTRQIHVLLLNSLKKLDELLEAAIINQQNEEDELALIMVLA